MATAPQLSSPLQVVFSYAHEDEALRDRLGTHLSSLERAHLIECWHDRDIRAGTGWRDAINQAIARADVVLLLISPDFVASDYCFTIEMADALKRHAAGTALVIPVLLRPVVAAGLPWAELQGLPRDLRAVTLWPNLDEALADVARGVLEALETWSPARPSPSTARPSAGEPVAQQRVFDAAVPSRVQVGQTSEIVSLVRTPDSGGLRAILAADDTFAARPEGVRSREVALDFPVDAQGRALPLRLTLTLEAPDFDPPRQTKLIQVPPRGDSAPYVFLAVPRRAGVLALELELLSGKIAILSHLLRSHAEEAPPIAPRRYALVSLPLATTAVDAEAEIELGSNLDQEPVRPAPAPQASRSVPIPATASAESTGEWRTTQAPPAPAARQGRSVALPALGALAAAALVSVSAWFMSVRTGEVSLPSTGPTTTLALHALPTQAPRPDPAVVLAEARGLYEKRDYAAVVALVEKAEAPTPQLHELAGRSLYEMGRYRQAAARFELAADGAPTNAQRLALLKRAQEAAGREQRDAH